MHKALIIYSSLTGNTAQIADILADELEDRQIDVSILDAMEADPVDLLEYDIICIGSYTFGNDAEIPDEMLDYYEEIATMDLSGKPFGVFGSGDDYYPKFATVVDDFEAQLIKSGAIKVAPGVKTNIAPDTEEELEAIQTLAQALADYFK
ncbi:flavodoxin [Eremococcus coleocola]|uniref:flavodoxin n=1 Tax=Eremococcus coleocola TaxID=88132 RepID=UPI000411AB9D|nr:flavodoxin [Eremococcus coleocola]